MTSRPFAPHPDKIQIEAYLLGHLEAAMRDLLEAHLGECDACAGAMEDIRREIEALSRLLEGSTEPVGSCLDDWRLAAFLDDQLSAQERRCATQHLAGCALCRGRLIALRAEVQDIAGAASEMRFGVSRVEECGKISENRALGAKQTNKIENIVTGNSGKRKISEK